MGTLDAISIRERHVSKQSQKTRVDAFVARDDGDAAEEIRAALSAT